MTDDGVAALREDLARSLTGGPWGEAAAVAVLLDFTPIAGNPKFIQHISRGGVGWTAALTEENWSEGERFLIATAASLWSGRGRAYGADVGQIPFLDDDFYGVWLAMVTASRTGKVPAAAAPDQGLRPTLRAHDDDWDGDTSGSRDQR